MIMEYTSWICLYGRNKWAKNVIYRKFLWALTPTPIQELKGVVVKGLKNSDCILFLVCTMFWKQSFYWDMISSPMLYVIFKQNSNKTGYFLRGTSSVWCYQVWDMLRLINSSDHNQVPNVQTLLARAVTQANEFWVSSGNCYYIKLVCT